MARLLDPRGPFPFRDAPGTLTVTVNGFRDGDPNFQVTDSSGHMVNDGVRLADLRKQFKGDEFDLLDPASGQTHHISLAQWAAVDPTATFIRIGFKFVPEAAS